MNNQLKSLASSFIIVYLFYLATSGIVRLFWNSKQLQVFEFRVKFLFCLIPLITLVYIVSIYHIVGVYRVHVFYKVFIILLALYFSGGILINEVYNSFFKNKKR